MKYNVVLKAAHGQPAAFDIDHILINLLETVDSERMYFVYMQYWSNVWTLYYFNVFEKSLLCSSSLHLFDQKYRQNQ